MPIRQTVFNYNGEWLWVLKGIEPDPINETQAWLEKWINTKKSERPTAVIAWEESHAIHLIKEAKKRKISIPKDLLIAGFDTTIARKKFKIKFPSTLPNHYQAGKLAARMTIQLAEGRRLYSNTRYLLPHPVDF